MQMAATRQEIEQRRRELAACRAESGPIKHDEVEAAVVRGGAELKVVRQVVPHRARPRAMRQTCDVHERTARQTVGPRFRGRRRYGLARFAAAPSRIRGRGERGGAVHLERGDSCAPLRVCGRITMLRTRTATSGAHVLVTRGCAVATGRALGAVHVLVGARPAFKRERPPDAVPEVSGALLEVCAHRYCQAHDCMSPSAHCAPRLPPGAPTQ